MGEGDDCERVKVRGGEPRREDLYSTFLAIKLSELGRRNREDIYGSITRDTTSIAQRETKFLVPYKH